MSTRTVRLSAHVQVIVPLALLLAGCGSSPQQATTNAALPLETPSSTVPTATATLQPTATATLQPTATATLQPTATATLQPTATATLQPTATATLQPTATATVRPTPTQQPPTPMPAPPGWVTVVDDEFTTAGIPAHWNLYDGHYGSGPADNCATPSQDSAPGDGYLYLTMAYRTSGTCGAGWYEGGMMISSAYEETQQRITVRWRIIPSAHPTVVRSHEIIPMIFPQTVSYDHAEDDLCETEQTTGCQTFLHYGGGSQFEKDYSLDLTTWHTMTFTQANGVITGVIDGVTVLDQNVGTTVLPDAVRRAVLQQECPASACPPATYAGDTEVIQVDYFILQIPG